MTDTVTSETFASVWDAIEDTPAAATNMKLRSALMTAIEEAVAGWGVTQAVAARRLGVTRPRLNDLLRGRISRFSLDALTVLATAAGYELTLDVRRVADVPAASPRRADDPAWDRVRA